MICLGFRISCLGLINVIKTKKILKESGIKPIKHRGQNFLVSKTILKKIIIAADIKPGDTILEVGPGTGNLTEALLASGARVVAVEKDSNLAGLLKSKVKSQKSKVIVGDIMDFDETTIERPYKVVANIPYYLTGRIIQKFLLSKNKPAEMILMIQKEVAERLTDRPPRANYFSSLIQFLAEPKILFTVKKDNFWPKPKVDSAVIKIIPHSRAIKTHNINPEKFVEFLKMVFRQPRQTLFNNLRKFGKYPPEKIKNVLVNLGLTENIRPQGLDTQAIKKLFDILQQLDGQNHKS